jgi:septum site-determining protein MinC
MQDSTLEFKGRKEGLFAVARGFNDFESFIEEMENKLSIAGDFFIGACLAGVYGISINKDEEDILRKILKDKYQINTRTPLIRRKSGGAEVDTEEVPTRFVRSTVRSGQKVSYNGNIVVLGDVNAGAEVEAGGNIVVMGVLRGVARAGIYGNNKAFIAAVSLQPTQLKIGEIAVRWPENQDLASGPETAYVEDGRVYVKPIFCTK